MDNFSQYSKYYDLLYKDKNYKAECDYVMQKIKSINPQATQILELGCGSGSHAQFFCEAGYKVTGVDKSAKMVKLAAEKKILGFNAICGDISCFELTEQFDVALSLFHVISYLTENESLINCFKTVHRHLKNDGIFIFDTWYSPAVYHKKPETRIKRLEDDQVEIIRLAESKTESEKNIVAVTFEVLIKDKSTLTTETVVEEHLMRHFSIP